MTKETLGMTLLLFSVLLLVIAAAGRFVFGEIGVSISACLLGALGYFLYPFLASVMLWSLVLVSGKRMVSAKWYLRTLCVLVSAFLIAHLATSGSYLGGGYAAYLSGCWSAASDGLSATAGGVLFGIAVYPFAALLSAVGAYVLFGALAALSVFFFLWATPLRTVLRAAATRPKAPKAAKAPRNEVKPVGVRRYPQEDVFDSLDEPLVPQGNGAAPDQPYNRYYDDPQDYNRRQYGQQNTPVHEPWQLPQPSYRAPEGAQQGVYAPQPEPYAPQPEPYAPQPEPYAPTSRDILFGDPGASYRQNLIYHSDSAFNTQRRRSSVAPASTHNDDNTPTTYVTRGGMTTPSSARGEQPTTGESLRRSSVMPSSARGEDNIPKTVVTRGGMTTPSSARGEQPTTGESLRRSSVMPSSARGEDDLPRTVVTRGGTTTPMWNSVPPAPEATYSDLYTQKTQDTPLPPTPRKIVEQAADVYEPRSSDALNYPQLPSYRACEPEQEEEKHYEEIGELFSSQPNINDDVPDNPAQESHQIDYSAEMRDFLWGTKEPYWRDPTLKYEEPERSSQRDEGRPTERDVLRGRSYDEERTTLRIPKEEQPSRLAEDEERTTLRIPKEEQPPRLTEDEERTTLRIPKEEEQRMDSLQASIGFGDPIPAPEDGKRDEPEESRVKQAMSSYADALDVDDEDKPTFLSTLEQQPPKQTQQQPPQPKPRVYQPYVRPDWSSLSDYRNVSGVTQKEVDQNSRIIVDTLAGFRVEAVVERVTVGATVTRYDIDVPRNVAVSQVIKRDEEIGMRLHTRDGVNIYPNSEKGLISIEVPNSTRSTVGLRAVMESEDYQRNKPGELMFAIGQDVEGRNVCGDIAKMTHILVAGATNSGKSVCLNAMLVSLVCKYSPEELRLILIDPKKIEFAPYDGLPHLMINEIITDTQKAIKSLNWAIKEMERRYTLFEQKTRAGTAVRNSDEYNNNLAEGEERLPKIVIVVDELADLMSVAKKDIEERIQRLTQKARAAGIHLVIATQRPSVDVVTGVIKGNLPTRMAFRVIQEVDSRTILDESGAQKLLGNGDMLYRTAGMFSSKRVQGAFISSRELQSIVADIKSHNESCFDTDMQNFIDQAEEKSSDGDGEGEGVSEEYIRALSYSVQAGTTSTSALQRRLSIGYNHAARIVDWMEMMGYILPYEGNPRGGRKVVLTQEEFESKYGSTKE